MIEITLVTLIVLACATFWFRRLCPTTWNRLTGTTPSLATTNSACGACKGCKGGSCH